MARSKSGSELSLEYIREQYKVPARVGKHVEYKGKRGVVTGGVNAYVEIKLEEEKHSRPYHPRDEDLNWLEGNSNA
jgi:hypothetical protein